MLAAFYLFGILESIKVIMIDQLINSTLLQINIVIKHEHLYNNQRCLCLKWFYGGFSTNYSARLTQLSFGAGLVPWGPSNPCTNLHVASNRTVSLGKAYLQTAEPRSGDMLSYHGR